MMNRLWMMGSLTLLLLSAALAEQINLDRVSGGGSRSTASGVILSGAIGAYGLPDGFAGQSRSAATLLGVGFYLALAAEIGLRNGADPAWLDLEEGGDCRVDSTDRPGPWLASGQKPIQNRVR